MDEYISREAMLKNLTADLEHHSDGGDPRTVLVMQRFIKYVEDFPATDVQPIKHGRWIITDDVEHFIAVCSECGRTEDSRGIKDMPYCHCGAKMDIIYEDDKIRAIKVTGWDDDTRNLTDEETDIYNNRLEAEAETIDEISLL